MKQRGTLLMAFAKGVYSAGLGIQAGKGSESVGVVRGITMSHDQVGVANGLCVMLAPQSCWKGITGN